MTASAVLDGGPAGAAERAFPALDGVRIVAATAVVVNHVASKTGTSYVDGLKASVLGHLDIGVAVFFVLSGFLLFRPFPQAAVRGRAAPGAGAYLWRRALRILPAYWLTVIAALMFLPDNEGTDAGTLMQYLALVHIYEPGTAFGDAFGLDHMWSLCTEVVFYAVLPLLAAGLAWLSRGRHGRPWPAMLAVGGLMILGPVYLFVTATWTINFPTTIWLPAFAGWFAGGMTLALLTVADRDWAPVRAARRLGSHLGLCWAGAAALYALACTPISGPHVFVMLTPREAVVRNILYMGIAVLFVLPLVLGYERGGPARRALSSPMAHRLGELSYGIFLVHMPLLWGLYSWFDIPVLTGGMVPVTVLILGPSVAIAAGLYVCVERPLRRLRSLVPDTARTTQPARDQAPVVGGLAAGSTT